MSHCSTKHNHLLWGHHIVIDGLQKRMGNRWKRKEKAYFCPAFMVQVMYFRFAGGSL